MPIRRLQSRWVPAEALGTLATEFGLNALGGGVDSRTFPFAQPEEDVALVIAEAISHPRADVYTRPRYAEQVRSYYAAEDPTAIEAEAPFMPAPDMAK